MRQSFFSTKYLFLQDSTELHSQNRSVNLQEFVAEAEALGISNIPWKYTDNSIISSAVIDTKWLAAQPLLPYLVRVIPAQILYKSMLVEGLDENIDVIQWIRAEQLTRILDFDLWSNQKESAFYVDVSPTKVLNWIELWQQISPEFPAERFFELEEEVIILMLTSILDIQPEGLNNSFDPENNDDYWTTPDNAFHIKLKPELKQDNFDVIHAFVRALYSQNVKLANSVFSYSAMLVRAESQETAIKWREGRLADAGFVSADEARNTIKFKNSSNLAEDIKKYFAKKQTDKLKIKSKIEKNNQLVTSYDPELYSEILQLLESLPTESAYKEIVNTLGQEKVFLLGDSENASPEHYAEDEDVLDATVEAIIAKCQKLLVQYGNITNKKKSTELLIEKSISYLSNYVNNYDNNISENSAIPDYLQNFTQMDLDLLKEKIIKIANNFSVGVSNSLDLSMSDRALNVVRGAINIGLEICISNPQMYGIEKSNEDEVDFSCYLLLELGTEFIFQIGWQQLGELTLELIQTLLEIGKIHPEKTYLTKLWTVNFSDGSCASYSLEKLFLAGRFTELRQWLSKNELQIGNPAVYAVFNGLLNRVPFYSELLEIQTNKGKATYKPFSTLLEVKQAKLFIEKLINLKDW